MIDDGDSTNNHDEMNKLVHGGFKVSVNKLIISLLTLKCIVTEVLIPMRGFFVNMPFPTI